MTEGCALLGRATFHRHLRVAAEHLSLNKLKLQLQAIALKSVALRDGVCSCIGMQRAITWTIV